MWWMHRRVDRGRLPPGRVVVEFDHTAPERHDDLAGARPRRAVGVHAAPGLRPRCGGAHDHAGARPRCSAAPTRGPTPSPNGDPRSTGRPALVKELPTLVPVEPVGRGGPGAGGPGLTSAGLRACRRGARGRHRRRQHGRQGAQHRARGARDQQPRHRRRCRAGGVGRNVAENLARLGTRCPPGRRGRRRPGLGDQVLAATAGGRRRRDAGSPGGRGRPGRTSRCSTRDGELVVAVADMAATESIGAPRRRRRRRPHRGGRAASSSTATSPPRRSAAPSTLCAAAGVRVVLDPVSVPKAGGSAGSSSGRTPVHRGHAQRATSSPRSRPPASRAGSEAARTCTTWRRAGVGPAGRGRLAAERPRRRGRPARRCRAEVVDVTGAGDAMLAAFCHALLAGATPADAAAYGHAAAALTVASPHTVRPDLTDELRRGASRDLSPAPLAVAHRRGGRRRSRDGAPVVALESTIISHGMPYPRQRRDGDRGRGHRARRTARCRRPSRCSTARPRIGLSPTTSSCSASDRRRRQGQRPRPAVRRRARQPRRDHRRLDDAARLDGRHPGVRHRRPRRRAPRRPAVLRRQRRPHRARPTTLAVVARA